MATSLSGIVDLLFQEQHLVLSSTDPDEVVEKSARILRPHQLEVRGKFGSFSAQVYTRDFGPFSVSRTHYGSDVSITHALPEDDHFIISLPSRGGAELSCGSSSTKLSIGHGAVHGPYEEFRFDMRHDFEPVILRLDRQRVEAVAAAMLGTSDPQRVNFNLSLANFPAFLPGLLETAVGLSILGSAHRYPKLLVQIEELIIETFLLTQPNNFTAVFVGGTSSAPGARIKRAMDYMLEHIAEPIRVSDVALHCGLSLRGLQQGFQRDLGTSPGQWLRSQRLAMVYEVLSRAIPSGSVSVTDVALQWGFTHLGEFAAQFKARYGKRPSDVLAKRA